MQFYLAAPLLMTLPRRVAIPASILLLVLGVVTPRPVGGYLWSVRPEGLLLGLALAQWRPALPAIGLSQAVYWLIVAAIFARVAQFGFTGASLTIVATIFAFTLTSRLGGKPASGRAAPLLRLIGRGSYTAYLVHLPILTGIRDLTIASVGPAASMSAALLAICIVAVVVEICIVRPASSLSRQASSSLIIKNRTLAERA